MIHVATIRLQSEPVGRLRVDPLQIRGDGGPLMPALIVPVAIDLFERQDQKLVLERLTATLWTQPGSGPRRRIGVPAILDTIGGEHGPLISLAQGAESEHRELRLELSPGALRLLDEHLQACQGSVAELSLTFEARVAWARQVLNDEPTSNFGTLLDLLPFWRTSTEEMQIQLPRERWARDIAPALGHDRVRLVAIGLPSPDGVFDADVVSIFDAAGRAYDAADWRECIQKCRDVRHRIEQQVRGTSQDSSVAQVIAQRLGVEESDPRVRFLDSTWKALAEVTNDAHHIDSIGRLQAATAHAALLITATMVQHVAELLGPA
jgi:hypothetical protein